MFAYWIEIGVVVPLAFGFWFSVFGFWSSAIRFSPRPPLAKKWDR